MSDAVIETENPNYGYEFGKWWAEMKDNREHQAFWLALPLAMDDEMLWNSMVHNFGQEIITDEALRDLPEVEADRMCDVLDKVDDVVGEISAGIELQYKIYGWKREEYDDVLMVENAVKAGLAAAFLLARSIGVSEVIE